MTTHTVSAPARLVPECGVDHPSHDGIHAETPECAIARAWRDADVTVCGLTAEEKIANARAAEERSRWIRANSIWAR